MGDKQLKREIIIGISFLLILVGLVGCTEEQTYQEESNVLNLFNWEDYLGETTIEDFEQRYNITVDLYTFDDEEYMLSALESNPGKYDLIVTSDSIISELIKTKSLSELNKENIPNINNINLKFLDPDYDPGNTYSVPYLWGTTGIGVDTSVVTENVTSWSVLWNGSYSGQITMLNNKYEVMAAALKYLGYSINTNNISHLNEAEMILLEQKEMNQGYESPTNIIDKMIAGNVAIAHSYVGDVYTAAEENENIIYMIPEEGAPLWVDTFAIPINAEHQKIAELFINYVLEPEVHANIANYLWQACPNEAAKSYIDEDILSDRGIYPSQQILDKCEYFNRDLENQVYSEYNRIWAELQS